MAESYSLEAILSARDTNFSSTMQSAQGAMGNMAKASSSFGNTMKGVVSGLGVFKIASAAIGAVTGSIDNAVSRVDTLANSARVFENMGFSASETESMMESLNDSITGLPTSLNDAVSGVQLLASSMGDIGKSQEVFSAMNNAILGFGGTAGMVDNAIVQLSQAFSNGKIDAQTWNSMINSGLGPSLNALAKEMGYTTGEFKSNLSDGTISVEEFQDALISLDKDGGGGLKSLQQIAQDSTKGISTSLANARTSITRGVANIITAIDTGLTNAGLGSISDIINGIGKAAERMLTGLAGGIEKLGTFIAPLVEGFNSILSPIDSATEAINAFSGATDELGGQVADVTELSEKWGTLTLDEKQASVDTLGQEELAELLELLGVDFESIPDEYTKEAYLNAYGKDALEEIIWVSGEWQNLTFDEKVALFEAQIDNDGLQTAINNMELWNNTEFMSKFANISWNDDDAEQQVVDLINEYRELEGLDPIDIPVNVDTKHAQRDIKGVRKSLKQFTKSLGPIGKMFDELSETQTEFWSDMSDVAKDGAKGMANVAKSVFKGDWKSAWDIFKDTSMDALEGTGNAIWKNLEGQFKAIGNLMKNTDWSKIFTTMGNAMQGAVNYIGDIGSAIFTWLSEKLANVNWGELGRTVGEWVGGALQNALDSVKSLDYAKIEQMFDDLAETIDTLALGLLEAASGALEGLIAGMGYEEELEDLKTFINDLGNIEFDGDFTALANQVKDAFKNAFGDWNLNDFLPKIRWQWGDYLSELDWTTGEWHEVDIETGARVKITEATIEEMDFASLINEGTKLGMIEQDIDGNFKINPNYTINTENSNIDESALISILKELLGEPEIGMGVSVAPEPKIAGGGAGKVGGMIEDEIKGQAPSEVTTNTNVNPETTLTEGTSVGGIGEKITSFIQSLAPKTVSTQVSVQPITSGGAGSTEAPQVDFSGMVADAQSAMQQANQAITNGMSNMASAVRMGTVMMNVAFRSGMNQAIITAQNTANRIVNVFTNLSSRMYQAGDRAGAGFRNGLANQSNSIINTAQSIANSVSDTIESALRIASPSKVTTYLGEMVGAGLIEGMDGMITGVEASANRLSLATLPTTDLGNSRYGGSISGTSTSAKLDEVIDAINRGQVIVMDSGALVGETSKQMDVALGQRGSLGGRHKL